MCDWFWRPKYHLGKKAGSLLIMKCVRQEKIPSSGAEIAAEVIVRGEGSTSMSSGC